MIGARTVGGLTAMMTIEAGTSGDVFVAYVKHVLSPELRDNDLVVMDNLGAHKDTRVRPLIEAAGAKIAYMPPYSPDRTGLVQGQVVAHSGSRKHQGRDR